MRICFGGLELYDEQRFDARMRVEREMSVKRETSVKRESAAPQQQQSPMMAPTMININSQMQQQNIQMMGNINMQQNSGQMAQMQQPQQPNLFQQPLAGVGGAQPQRAPQTYGHNDPFAQMMSGGGGQPAPVVANRPKKAGPDPFADLALGSMK